MGQYYRFYMTNGKEERVMCPFDYGNTFKLMEHSWIGNNFCNQAVASLMDMGGGKVYHLGDYADDLVSKEIYRKTWGDEDGEDLSIRFRDMWEFDQGEEVFIICPERKEYIRYPFQRKGDNWYANHFALLTALGNQRGGGDYYGSNEDMVGLWAGLDLEVVTKEPAGLKKIHGWMFKEE